DGDGEVAVAAVVGAKGDVDVGGARPKPGGQGALGGHAVTIPQWPAHAGASRRSGRELCGPSNGRRTLMISQKTATSSGSRPPDWAFFRRTSSATSGGMAAR